MLDLSVPTRSVAGVDLAADTEDRFAFYVLPPAPRLSRTDGAPSVQLLRLVSGGALTGGHIRLGASLIHPPQLLDQVREALVSELKRDRVTLSPVPVTDASAELLFAGRETTPTGGLGDLIRREYGRAAALLDPPHAVNFSFALTPDGVRLIEAAMRSAGAPIGIIYRLRIDGLWPAQRIVARVDWGRVYDHFSANIREGSFFAVSIQAIQGLAEGDGNAGVSIEPALDWIQRELVERFCEPVIPLDREPARASLGTLGEIFGVGYSFAVKKRTQVERAVAEVDFQRAQVLSRTVTSQAHIADLLEGAPPDAHIEDATTDHPFFRRMSLAVRSAQPLESLHLKEAVLHFAYGTAEGAMRLTPEAREASAEMWADAAPDRTWHIRPTVSFADDAPLDAGLQVALEELSGQSRDLTLDFKRMLGLARLEVRPSIDSRVAMSEVGLVHFRGQEQLGEQELAIAPQTSAQTAWFRDFRDGDRIQAAPKYLLGDGRLIPIPPYDIDAEIVRLPAAFPGFLTVQLISDEDWADLERVVVTIQKTPESVAGIFVFDQPNKVIAVNLDMPDPTDRTFRFRMTRSWSDGKVEEDNWVPSDVPVVLVGKTAANKLVVDVTPVGLELPQAGLRLIEVELSYIDVPNQVRDQKTAVIGSRADRFHWEVALQDPQRRAYEYRVTRHRSAGGPPDVGRWTTTAERLLVIPVAAN